MLPCPTKLRGLRKAFLLPEICTLHFFLEVLDFSLLNISLPIPPKTPGLVQSGCWGPCA